MTFIIASKGLDGRFYCLIETEHSMTTVSTFIQLGFHNHQTSFHGLVKSGELSYVFDTNNYHIDIVKNGGYTNAQQLTVDYPNIPILEYDVETHLEMMIPVYYYNEQSGYFVVTEHFEIQEHLNVLKQSKHKMKFSSYLKHRNEAHFLVCETVIRDLHHLTGGKSHPTPVELKTRYDTLVQHLAPTHHSKKKTIYTHTFGHLKNHVHCHIELMYQNDQLSQVVYVTATEERNGRPHFVRTTVDVSSFDKTESTYTNITHVATHKLRVAYQHRSRDTMLSFDTYKFLLEAFQPMFVKES